ncbi:50S ribosomal protein L9 [Puniceicoccaceae bacterium K14]|nr:50S ribosomal protein L9 [Puniceicoccaceae bacterium K14]
MATSEILLIEPIEGLGAEGDTVVVKAGYARNYLLPQKKALPITRANRKQVEALKTRRASREAKNLEDAKFLAEKIGSLSFAIAVKTGDSGKMFGAVTVPNILEKTEEAGVKLERKQIQLADPIKELGQHTVTVKVHPEVEASLKFDVVSENPIQEEADAADES